MIAWELYLLSSLEIEHSGIDAYRFSNGETQRKEDHGRTCVPNKQTTINTKYPPHAHKSLKALQQQNKQDE